MFSRILIKMVDRALVPAAVLFFARVAGVLFTAKYFQIPLDPTSSFFRVYFSNSYDYVKVNSYSLFIMGLVVAFFSLLFLFKSRVLHETHISPKRMAAVMSLGLGRLVKGSLELYSEGAVWLSYSYLLTMLCGLEALDNVAYPAVFVFSLCISVLLTLVFVSDVEKELVR